METNPQPSPEAAPPVHGGNFAWSGLALALPGAVLFGAFWAWAAEVAEAYAAPFLLFPILLGILTGLSIVALARFARIGNRPTIVLAVILAALVAGWARHGVTYLNAYHASNMPAGLGNISNQDVAPLLQKMKPSFGQYMNILAERGRPLAFGYTARGVAAWIAWTLDSLLVVLGAVVVTIPAMRVPFCNRCGTWYRTVRGGKIDVATAVQLAGMLGVDEVGTIRSPRCRLMACHCGRSPTRCDLSWEDPDGAIAVAQVWLNPSNRNQAYTILDGLNAPEDEG